MSFVIYDKKSTVLFYAKGKRWYDNKYATEAAAKAALTRELNAGRLTKKAAKQLAIADKATFHATIEKQVEKRNLMSGKPIMVSANEPLCTDPSSETYWSM